MKLTILCLLLFYSCSSFAQIGVKALHYKKEEFNYGSSGRTYDVNTLSLNPDSSFLLLDLSFHNKKASKKSTPISRSITQGFWSIEKDTINLEISDPETLKGRELSFFYAGKNIFFFVKPLNTNIVESIKKHPWKKVKVLKFTSDELGL